MVTRPGETMQHLYVSTLKLMSLYMCLWCVFWQLTDRECQLDIALLRCGKLCEGLESFKDWLSDVESRQSKQKPFSIDHKALGPQQQIQEVYQDVIYLHHTCSINLSVVHTWFIWHINEASYIADFHLIFSMSFLILLSLFLFTVIVCKAGRI